MKHKWLVNRQTEILEQQTEMIRNARDNYKAGIYTEEHELYAISARMVLFIIKYDYDLWELRINYFKKAYPLPQVNRRVVNK